jgi:hypothetical protein
MNYGAQMLNFERSMSGKPACSCTGISGAALFARAVLIRHGGVPLNSVQQIAPAAAASVIGPLPGYEDDAANIAIVRSNIPGTPGGTQLAAVSAYADVQMVTKPDGSPQPAGEALADAELQVMEIDDLLASMEDGVTDVLRIQGVDADAAARRSVWYENSVYSYVDRLTYIKFHQMLRLAVDMEIIKAAPDLAKYKKRLTDLEAQMRRNSNRSEGLKQTMREWVVEARVQAKKAESQGTFGRIGANLSRYADILSNATSAIESVVTSVKKAGEGLEEIVDDSKKAAGMAGFIALAVVGGIAVLALSSRKK